MTDPTERNEADVAGLVEELRELAAQWSSYGSAGRAKWLTRSADALQSQAATLTTYAARIAELEAEVAARDTKDLADALKTLGNVRKMYVAAEKREELLDQQLAEARDLLTRLADAYTLLCGDTGKNYDQSPCSHYAHARAFLARSTDGGGK
jgi:DNA repair exonuclease SbcCD ATPase subunit